MPPTKIASTHGMPVPISAGTSTPVTNSAASATMPIASGGTPCHGCAAHVRTAMAMMTAVISSARLIAPSCCICHGRPAGSCSTVRGRPHRRAGSTPTTSPHQMTVGTAMTRAYSNHVIGRPAFANSPAMNGPNSDPVSTAQPGRTAISKAPRTMSAAPRPGSGRLIGLHQRERNRHHDRRPHGHRRNAERQDEADQHEARSECPRRSAGRSSRMRYEMRRASPVLSMAVPKKSTHTRIQNAPVAKPLERDVRRHAGDDEQPQRQQRRDAGVEHVGDPEDDRQRHHRQRRSARCHRAGRWPAEA